MNLETQNYIVYVIVILALFKFTQPVLEMIYKTIFKRNIPVSEDNSCYTGTCAKCKVKV